MCQPKIIINLHSFCRILTIGILVFTSGCTQSYTPPATKGVNKYLVVDGLIIPGPDSTIFTLSNSANLSSPNGPTPEIGAQVLVEGSTGFSRQLPELGNGRYGTDSLPLDTSQQYRIDISTINGNHYLSDFVPLVQSPPIDSVSWKQLNDGVEIYVSSHDAQNLVKYYRWEFVETWEYHTNYDAIVIDSGGAIVDRDPNEQDYNCWSSSNSSDIIIGSSVNLNQALIYEQPLTLIPTSSVKLSDNYSILVKQFGMTKDAYAFWQNLKTNTEELGTLFEPQPSEVAGNIHCTNNPSLPVLGYVSAGNSQDSRIFINNLQLNNWGYFVTCTDTTVFISDFYLKYVKIGYVPYQKFQVSEVKIAQAPCVNCALAGPGNTLKPPFWP
jgi:hypothetical protein